MRTTCNFDAQLLAALGPRGECPAGLHQAMVQAILPGGARLRPKLCLAVATSTSSQTKAAPVPQAEVAAVAIELLHCASLVHDDLPCFDDADLRRGRPSIHVCYGEALATLAGDGLMMAAFTHLGRLTVDCAVTVLREIGMAARRTVWGQALEAEADIDLVTYHGHKTAALFEAATVCGAYLAAEAHSPGVAPSPQLLAAWRKFGGRIGRLYQMADDILDVATTHPSQTGKWPGRDSRLGRPNHATKLGLPAARQRLGQCLREARVVLQGAEDDSASVMRWFDNFEQHLRRQPGLLEPILAPHAGRLGGSALPQPSSAP